MRENVTFSNNFSAKYIYVHEIDNLYSAEIDYMDKKHLVNSYMVMKPHQSIVLRIRNNIL